MTEGDLRVWWAREVPIKKSHYPVKDVESALGEIDKLAEEDLKDESIISNVGGLQIFIKGEWIDWEDKDGNFFEDIEKMDGDEQQEYFKRGRRKMSWKEMMNHCLIPNCLSEKEVIKIVERAEKEEREKIEKRFEKYMKDTCLEQDSIFVKLHDLIFEGEKQ